MTTPTWRKGMRWPGQMQPALCRARQAIRKIVRNISCMGLCMLEAAAEHSWHFDGAISASMYAVSTPYNNSFELLVKDLQQWKKEGRTRDPAVRIQNQGETSGRGPS